MNAKEIIEAAVQRLVDEHDEDPRSALVRGLSALLDAETELPTGELELVATIQPGGAFTLTDQHGRPVRGVKAVAAFHDQAGQPVFQVTL